MVEQRDEAILDRLAGQTLADLLDHLTAALRQLSRRSALARILAALTGRTSYVRRRAPTQDDAYQPSLRLEIFTTSPVCGAWMNWPPPM